YTKKWMRVSRIVLKCLIVVVALVMPLYQSYSQFTSNTVAKQPVKNGVYEVTKYRLNNQDLPFSIADTLLWQDLIFEDGAGSVRSNDTIFRRRYNRGYFAYGLDSAKHLLGFKKRSADKHYIMEFNYAM